MKMKIAEMCGNVLKLAIMGSSIDCTNSPNVRQQTFRTITSMKLAFLGRTM